MNQWISFTFKPLLVRFQAIFLTSAHTYFLWERLRFCNKNQVVVNSGCIVFNIILSKSLDNVMNNVDSGKMSSVFYSRVDFWYKTH